MPAKRSLDYEQTPKKKRKYEDGQFEDAVDDVTKTPSRRKTEKTVTSPGGCSDTSVDSMSSDAQDLPEPLELPSFTQSVRCALRDGECDSSVWNMVSKVGYPN